MDPTERPRLFDRIAAIPERWRTALACAALLLLMGANLVSALSRKSISNDEVYHIPAGFYHLTEGFYRIGSEHPPLAKMWAAIPLLGMKLKVPTTPGPVGETYSDMTWRLVSGFWVGNQDDFLAICYRTRFFMVLLTLALGALICVYTRALFGPRAALLAVALFVAEPTVLGHGRLVTTDVPSALTYFLVFVALDGYLRGRTWRRALLVGAAAGVALVTKFSMVAIVPVLATLALGGVAIAPRLGERRAALALHASLAALAVLFAVNFVYAFQSAPLVASDLEWLEPKSPESLAFLADAIRVGSKVLPTDFLVGIHNIVVFDRLGSPASLLGQYGTMGWWYYFPVAFALKTSLPFLLVSIAALAWAVRRLVAGRDGRLLLLLVPVALYLALAMRGHANIGVRHLLPIFPFLFVLGGGLLDRLLRVERRRLLALATVVMTLGWAGAEAVRSYPDYIPYMNQLAWRHPHWWYLSDSNVEWGDDVQELAGYLHARGESAVTGALSGGWTLKLYGIDYSEIYGTATPATRYVAVGASFLNGSTVYLPPDADGKLPSEEERVGYFAAFRDRQPEAVFGRSIYLYRMR